MTPLDFTCPTCSAAPSQFCRTGTGRKKDVPHTPRRDVEGLAAAAERARVRQANAAAELATPDLFAAEGRRTVRLVLVGCADKKAASPCAAKDLYTSQLFKAARAHAEHRVALGAADGWAILSGKHGLVMPDEVVAPYDQRAPGAAETMSEWGARVVEQLRAAYPGAELILSIFAGVLYAVPVASHARDLHLGWDVREPMAHMQIGERLSWFKRNAPEPVEVVVDDDDLDDEGEQLQVEEPELVAAPRLTPPQVRERARLQVRTHDGHRHSRAAIVRWIEGRDGRAPPTPGAPNRPSWADADDSDEYTARVNAEDEARRAAHEHEEEADEEEREVAQQERLIAAQTTETLSYRAAHPESYCPRCDGFHDDDACDWSDAAAARLLAAHQAKLAAFLAPAAEPVPEPLVLLPVAEGQPVAYAGPLLVDAPAFTPKPEAPVAPRRSRNDGWGAVQTDMFAPQQHLATRRSA